MRYRFLIILLIPCMAMAAEIEQFSFTHDGKDVGGNDQEPSSFALYVGPSSRGTCTRFVGTSVAGEPRVRAPDCYPTMIPLPDPTLRTIENQVFPLAGVADGDLVVASMTAWDDEGNESEYGNERTFRISVVETDFIEPTSPNLVTMTLDEESLEVLVTCPSGKTCKVTVVEE